MLACEHGHAETAQYLLSQGADPNVCSKVLFSSEYYYPDGRAIWRGIAQLCSFFPIQKARENSAQECITSPYCPPIQVMIDLLYTLLHKNHLCNQ